MTQEKQNKLNINNINLKTGDLESDCVKVNSIQSAVCYKDVSIAHINAGNPIISSFFRIGVVLNNETEVKLNFILEFGFIQWGEAIVNYPSIIHSYNTLLEYLNKSLVTGNKVDLCVNTVDPEGYRIVDVALKKQ